VLALAEVPINPEIYEKVHINNSHVQNIQYENIQYDNAQYQNVQYDNNQNMNLQPDENQNMNTQYNSDQNIQYDNNQYQNIQYDNQQYRNQPVIMYQNNAPRSYGQRFKILNEYDNASNKKQHIIERLQPATVTPQRLNTQRQTQTFNIYDYYSSSNFEPMHKIKS